MVDNNCIIEGNVKFRDGKKWKSRWCVMRKLSPVADCLHLQLYGDSKDRYKQGQTKASLSLQHFLGVQSGFTLDKESNTIAIICQDVTVVLAFDTRERLIQWQVKISNNLGEDQEFLVLISSAPARAKLSSGPAQLHVREQRFCMTLGVPPRLVGTWEIGQLRRYGVVEGRFCFEGGSRCGRGEGLHVLVSDQAEEIARALQLAAGPGRKRALLDSPRRQAGFGEPGPGEPLADGASSYWASAESRQLLQEPDAASLLSAAEHGPADWRSCSLSRQHSGSSHHPHHLHQQPQQLQHHASAACLERCSSCISKLGGGGGGSGGMSKSSTCATAITAGPSPLGNLGHLLQPRAFDRLSLSSYSSSNSHESDYSASPQPAPPRPAPQPQALPPRPPKPSAGPRKPPMPLPLEPRPAEAGCTCKRTAGTPTRNGPAYENYDVPKTILHQQPSEQQSPQADLNYDTPRKIKECLAAPAKAYPNYDTPHAPQAVVLQQCGCPAAKLASATASARAPKAPLGCPCQNVMSWAGFVLPYCRRGAGIEPTGVSVQPVRLSGEGKMPVVNASGQLTIYSSPGSASAETSQASSRDGECPVHPSPGSFSSASSCSAAEDARANYENVEPGVIDTQPEPRPANYANIDFSESLGHYENSKTLLTKVAVGPRPEEAGPEGAGAAAAPADAEPDAEPDAVCQKCGHAKEAASCPDYLVVDEGGPAESPKKPVPGYLPMQPAHNACSKQLLSRLCGGVKSSSNPALSGPPPLEPNRKRSESEYRVPGSAVLSSPYFRRRLLDASLSSPDAGGSLGMLLRKRSYSAESAHYLDDDDEEEEEEEDEDDKSLGRFPVSAQVHKCPGAGKLASLEAADSETETTTTTATTTTTTTTTTNNDSPEAACPSPLNPLAAIKIRRSSSVPSKTVHNRDSSSSNDSGVSTGSLSHRAAEFGEYEFPVGPGSALLKKQSVPLVYRKSPPPACFHASLPRKSKSSDPLKEITFQFHKVKLPAKSSSAEADIPTCLPPKVPKEFSSPGDASSVPYIDSRSTSSGTSDMSDYIETLSLSSHSSSDVPQDSLRISGRAVATTLRPRSGKEYYKIDRSILVEQGRGAAANYANIAPCARKEAPRHPVT